MRFVSFLSFLLPLLSTSTDGICERAALSKTHRSANLPAVVRTARITSRTAAVEEEREEEAQEEEGTASPPLNREPPRKLVSPRIRRRRSRAGRSELR